MDPLQDLVLLKSLAGALRPIWTVAFCQDLLAAGGMDNKVRIYDAAQEFYRALQVDAVGLW